MAEKHEGEERELIKLGGAIAEGRSDIAEALTATREARDTVLERVGRRTGPHGHEPHGLDAPAHLRPMSPPTRGDRGI
jgi:hypothetical protein